jgi:hypothetical protein
MGGNGNRLGMPFPKPLAPIITRDGIMPVYKNSLAQVHRVTREVYGLVRPLTCSCLRVAIAEDEMVELSTIESNLPAALGDAGRMITQIRGAKTLVVTVLPDSIWKMAPGKSLWDVVRAVRSDGALALFSAGADQLDNVLVDGDRVSAVVTKDAEAKGTVNGWGAFVIRAGSLALFTDAEKDGPQLGKLDMGWALLGDYIDLGTQDRYINHHDTRGWA